jgi:hypothetical protein
MYLAHPIGAFPSDWRELLARMLTENRWALYLYSKSNGSGKSCFAGAVLKAYRESLIRKGMVWPEYLPGNQGGRWMSIPHWLPRIRTLDTWPHHRERFAETPFLVLDDLAAGRNTPYVVEELTLLLMRRYEANRRTIITSNLPLGELAATMDRRLASRLQSGIIIQAGEVDWRGRPPAPPAG